MVCVDRAKPKFVGNRKQTHLVVENDLDVVVVVVRNKKEERRRRVLLGLGLWRFATRSRSR